MGTLASQAETDVMGTSTWTFLREVRGYNHRKRIEIVYAKHLQSSALFGRKMVRNVVPNTLTTALPCVPLEMIPALCKARRIVSLGAAPVFGRQPYFEYYYSTIAC